MKKFAWLIVGISMSVGLGVFAVWHIGQKVSIKNVSIPVQGASSKTPQKITLKPGENKTAYSSPTFKAKFQFNAIAPHWQETNASDSSRSVAIRTSNDGHHWSDWASVEGMIPQKDNAPHANEMFPEAPIITLGSYFQYQISLHRQDGAAAPIVQNMTVTYLDSRESTLQKFSSALHSYISPTATATGTIPRIISRAEWGSPDPTGDALKGQDSYWTPQYHPVTQVFIHHTVDSNYKSQTDGASLVRAIWQYHTYTLGWGDIGYNYLVDESGNTYQGRAHGDNIDAGHVYGYNSGSMGVALLGCFQSDSTTCKQLDNYNVTAPSSSMLNSLTDLLAWKATGYEIDPQAQHQFCNSDGVSNCLNLNTISGHRDGYPTSCPGDLAYRDLQSIRSTTAAKKAQNFAYSAKQQSYSTTSAGTLTETMVTLKFKNTGTQTWVNSVFPMTLRTAEPTDHVSPFEGTDWINHTIASTMTEASVAPGGTGTFSFHIKYPASLSGDQWEYFRLTATGITDLPGFFSLPIKRISEVPWTFETLDGGKSSLGGNTGDIGAKPATVVFNNILHVFYYDATKGLLRHAWKDGSGWHFAVVDGAIGQTGSIVAKVGQPPAATIFNNSIQLFYYDATNGDLRHGTSDSTGTSWNLETLDGSGGVGGRYIADVGTNITVTPYLNGLQAFYYDNTHNNLRHTWTDTQGTWHFENLDGDIGSLGHMDGDIGQDPTVTTYGTSLQLYYYDSTRGNLRHAWSNASGWHFENLDGDSGSIGHLNADLGRNPNVIAYNNSVQLLYYDATNSNLRHAWSNDSGWHFENLDGDSGSISRYTGTIGITPTMSITSDGRLEAFYYDYDAAGSLRWANADTTGWHFETFDGTGGLPATRVTTPVGLNPEAVMNGTSMDVFYYDIANKALRHASLN